MKFKNNPQLLFSGHGEIVQQTCLLQELCGTQANPDPVQSMADTALHVGHREQATLTFGDDIQDHIYYPYLDTENTHSVPIIYFQGKRICILG